MSVDTEKKLRPIDMIRQDVARIMPEVASALPRAIPSERFQKTLIIGVLSKPDLVRKITASPVARNDFMQAVMKAAGDGLILDGREAALVDVRKKTGVDEKGKPIYDNSVMYMPMTYGLMKKARNSGEIASITATLVHEKDSFSFNPGVDDTPMHNPDWFGDRGAAVGVYAVARLKDGTFVVEIMNRTQLLKVQGASKSKDSSGNLVGPWKDWPDEMWRKSAIKRLIKYLPSATDKESGQNLMDIADRDAPLYEEDAGFVVDEPKPVERVRKGAKAVMQDVAKDAAKPTSQQPKKTAPVEDHDPDTGEIIEGDVSPEDQPDDEDLV